MPQPVWGGAGCEGMLAGKGMPGMQMMGKGAAGMGMSGKGVPGMGVAGNGMASSSMAGSGTGGNGMAGNGMASNGMAGMGTGISGMGTAGKGMNGAGMAGMGRWGQGMDGMGIWGQGMDGVDKWGDMWGQCTWGQGMWDSWDSWGQGMDGMDMWSQAMAAMGMGAMGMGMSASSSAGCKGGQQYSSPFKPKASNPPEKVFVGGLPNSTTQEGLRAYFENFGRVRSVELKYDNTGNFRGYGFILFEDKAVAEKVFATKGHEYNGKSIDCRRPLDSGGPNDNNDNKVFVGGLPKTCTKQTVEAYFEQRFGRVASLQLKYDSDDNFRGFAFVTFEDPAVADVACRTKGQMFDGKAIDCRPADSDGPGEQLDKMFVGGLPKNATPQQVEEHFSQFGAVLSVDMKYHEEGKYAGKFRGFCFVQFADREAAEKVYRNYENNRFDGKWITCRPAAKKPLIEDALDAAMKTQMNSPVPTAQLLGIDPNVAAARVAAYSAVMALNQAAAHGTSNPALGDAVGSTMGSSSGPGPGGAGVLGSDSTAGATGSRMCGAMGGSCVGGCCMGSGGIAGGAMGRSAMGGGVLGGGAMAGGAMGSGALGSGAMGGGALGSAVGGSAMAGAMGGGAMASGAMRGAAMAGAMAGSMRAPMGGAVGSSMCSAMGGAMGGSMAGSAGASIGGMNGAMGDAMGGAMAAAVGGRMGGSLGSGMDGGLGEAMAVNMGCAMGNAWGQGMGSFGGMVGVGSLGDGGPVSAIAAQGQCARSTPY
mmetsp:Transcript_90345/g.292424  ORF Transcript_90345/g.292424 Transcript_90345/m.292424 type:complete len:758 (-) Transcript_90345:182-2455(-)